MQTPIVKTVKKLKLLAASVTLITASFAASADIHFLIPGGPGGGWDTTARSVGEAMMKSGIDNRASFQNMSGGGGGRAIAYLLEIGNKRGDMLMVNSTPIVIRALSGSIPNSHHDLAPVANLIADFGAFAVRHDSPLTTWQQVIEQLKQNPSSLRVAGGSARGSMDHLVAAQAIAAAGLDGRRLRYIPYDAGGEAKAGLLSGEVEILSTGLSEALELANAGQARILAITSEEPIAEYPELPTLKSLGYDMSFINWRGFFASPDTSAEKIAQYNEQFVKLLQTPEWEEVRKRNGWINMYLPAADFKAMLDEQETELKQVMLDLGFIRK